MTAADRRTLRLIRQTRRELIQRRNMEITAAKIEIERKYAPLLEDCTRSEIGLTADARSSLLRRKQESEAL